MAPESIPFSRAEKQGKRDSVMPRLQSDTPGNNTP
jgi:hypothetical protein